MPTMPTTPSSAPLDPSQSTLSPNFAPYIYDMLSKGQGLANLPYQPYTGQRYAGPSPLQQQAFTGIAGLQTPGALQQSANLLNQAGQAAGGFGYTPGQFGVQVGGTGLGSLGFSAGQFGADTGQANFGGLGYTPGQITTGLGPVGSVTDYMNPYTQNVTNVLAREATRQAEIQRQADQARLAQAGAYGGSRQAILDAERARNLATQISDIREKGLTSAFEQAQKQRLAEAQLGTEAQRLTEAGRQFGAGYGLDVEKAAEAARQFRAQQGLEAQRLGEQSRQFGAGYGLDVEKAAEAARQFRAQQGLEAQRLGEQSRQFGATSGLDALGRQIAAAQGLAQTGIQQSAADRALEELRLSAGAAQQGLDQRNLDFGYQQWQESMKYPYQQATFMQSLLQGLPMQAARYDTGTAGESGMTAFLRGLISALGLEQAVTQGTARARDGGEVRGYAEGGIVNLPGAQQAPGQAAPAQVLPPQQPQTPQAVTAQLQNLPPQQLLQMFANPADKTPKWAVVSAYAKAVEQQRLMEAASGQAAMQQAQAQAQQPPVAAQVMMQQPMQMARNGGIMQGYAGGGAVAFKEGGKTAFPGLPEESGARQLENYIKAGDFDRPFVDVSIDEPLLDKLVDFLAGRTVKRPAGAGRSAGIGGPTVAQLASLIGTAPATSRPPPSDIIPAGAPPLSSASNVPLPGMPPGSAPAGAAPAAPAPEGGLASLMGPQIEPERLAARGAQQMAERALAAPQITETQTKAREGLDKLMGEIIKERQAEEARRLAQAESRVEEARQRAGRRPLEDIAFLGQMLEGMRGSNRLGDALAGAAAGAGRAQTAREEALRRAEERYDMSRTEIATLAGLRQQLQVDQARAAETRASGDARAAQDAAIKVADSRMQLAKFEAELADKAEGRKIERERLALTASEGAAGRAASAVPAEARFLEWLRSPANRALYDSVQSVKNAEDRRLKLYELYIKNKLQLGDTTFENFAAGFSPAAVGVDTPPPPNAVRIKGQK